jgi:hypothetical protein
VPRAELCLRTKLTDDETSIREIVIWQVERSTNTPDGVRYRLAFVPAGERRPSVLYDNHPPKGHHRHIGGTQSAYQFESVEKLLSDFEASIKEYLERH